MTSQCGAFPLHPARSCGKLVDNCLASIMGPIEKSPCIEWIGGKTGGPYGGYGHYYVGRGRRDRRKVYVHRIAWEEVNGPIPEGMQVLHRCDNPSCYNVNHLFLGTQADNLADARSKGRRPTAQHGTVSKYNLGCRCEDCRGAMVDHWRNYRAIQRRKRNEALQ